MTPLQIEEATQLIARAGDRLNRARDDFSTAARRELATLTGLWHEPGRIGQAVQAAYQRAGLAERQAYTANTGVAAVLERLAEDLGRCAAYAPVLHPLNSGVIG